MKKIIISLLAICLLFSLIGCNNDEETLSIEKAFNLLDKPITEFPYYNLETCEDYETTLFNNEEYNKQLELIKEEGIAEGDYELFEEYYLEIDFERDADASGFLGIKNHNIDYICVNFEYDLANIYDDAKTKITSIDFYYDEDADKEYINKIMLKYFEKKSDDFTRTENKYVDYEYTYKYNEDKKVCFGKDGFEYMISFVS